MRLSNVVGRDARRARRRRPGTPASCRSPAPSPGRGSRRSRRCRRSRIDTGSLGVSTKWNTLSAGSASVPARTVPRTFGSASVNGANVTDADAFGRDGRRLRLDLAAVDRRASPGRPVTAASPLLLRPAVTVMRSWPENAARAKRDRRHGQVRRVRRRRPTRRAASCPRESGPPRRRSSRSSGSR